MSQENWTVYLSGEIHTDWRDRIAAAIQQSDLPVSITGPVTDHSASDNCGDEILGPESDPFWKDHKAAKINAIRTRTMIEMADVVVVRFGEKYRQWNAAFDAGFTVARGKPLIVMHDEENRHALKEVDAQALAVTKTPEEVAGILRYVITQK